MQKILRRVSFSPFTRKSKANRKTCIKNRIPYHRSFFVTENEAVGTFRDVEIHVDDNDGNDGDDENSEYRFHNQPVDDITEQLESMHVC